MGEVVGGVGLETGWDSTFMQTVPCRFALEARGAWQWGQILGGRNSGCLSHPSGSQPGRDLQDSARRAEAV